MGREGEKTKPNKAKQSQLPAFRLEILNKTGGEKFLSLAFFAGEGNLCSRSAFCVQSTTERSPLNSERKMAPAIIASLFP